MALLLHDLKATHCIEGASGKSKRRRCARCYSLGGDMGFRLFLVDSSPAVQRLIEQAVAAEGFEVSAFRRAHSALEAVKRQKPHLIVVDYHLEDMAFAAFCERLTIQEGLSRVPIISLVGSSDRLDERHMQSLGVKAVLRKPLQSEDLLEMVRLLHRGQTAEALHQTAVASGAGIQDATAAVCERNGANAVEPVRLSDLAGKPSPALPAMPDSPHNTGDTASDAMRGIVAQLLQSLVERAERSLAARLPELVSKEVASCMESTQSSEKVGSQVQTLVDRLLPGLTAERVTAMEPIIQQTVKTITTAAVKEILETHVRDLISTMLPASLAEALKEHLVRAETSIKEIAQEAALRQARETAETIVREVSRDVIKGVFEQAMREMAAGLTPAH